MLKASLRESQQRPRGKHPPQPNQHVSHAPNMPWQRASTHWRGEGSSWVSWPGQEGLVALLWRGRRMLCMNAA